MPVAHVTPVVHILNFWNMDNLKLGRDQTYRNRVTGVTWATGNNYGKIIK